MNEIAEYMRQSIAIYDQIQREGTQKAVRAEIERAVRGESFWGLPDSTAQENDYCFVVMAFDPKLTQIYEQYIKKPLESHTSLTCRRADDIFQSTHIVKDIWNMLCSAKIVIADLTQKNANVYYELGLAHAIGKKVILIAQNLEEVPFDLRHIRIIVYQDSPQGFKSLSTRVVQFVKNATR